MGGYTVLIVDDHDHGRRCLAEYLQAVGCKAIEADSGEAALRLLERCVPDVIVIDIVLPGIDGVELLRRVRHHYGSVYAVGISGVATSDVGAMALFDDFVRKPSTLGAIASVVKRGLT